MAKSRIPVPQTHGIEAFSWSEYRQWPCVQKVSITVSSSLFCCCEETPGWRQLLSRKAFNYRTAYSFRGLIPGKHGGEHGGTKQTWSWRSSWEFYTLICRMGWGEGGEREETGERDRDRDTGPSMEFWTSKPTPSDTPPTRSHLILIILQWASIQRYEPMKPSLFRLPQ